MIRKEFMLQTEFNPIAHRRMRRVDITKFSKECLSCLDEQTAGCFGSHKYAHRCTECIPLRVLVLNDLISKENQRDAILMRRYINNIIFGRGEYDFTSV